MLTHERSYICIGSLLVLLLVGCQRPPSDVEANKEEVVRAVLAAIDAQNFGRLSELLADDFVVHFVGYPDRVGRDVAFELIRGTYASFPDYTHVVEEMITEGDRVVVRLTYQGTHQGEREGIAPTGEQVNYAGVQIYTVVDGVARDVWILDDRLALMSQLGMALTPVEGEP